MNDKLAIYGVHIDNLEQELEYKHLLNIISNERREKIRRLSNHIDVLRSIVSELLVRYTLHCNYHVPINEIKIINNNYGKPMLLCEKPIHFNITHSGEWVLVAFDISPIGVDIEEVKSMDISFVNHFLSIEESDYLNKIPTEEKLEEFYKIWCLKESYVKAIGKGLYIPLSSFSVLPYLQSTTYQVQDSNWYIQNINFQRNYKMAICTKGEKTKITINTLSIKHFLNLLNSTFKL